MEARLFPAWLFLVVSCVAQGQEFFLGEINTPRGRLVAGHANSDVRSPDLDVLLNSGLIYRTSRYDIVAIVAAYPSRDSAELVLLQYGGGTPCEGFFRIVDLRGTGPARLSEEFGNCNYLVQPKEWQAGGLMSNPVFRDGAWYIALPSADEPRKKLTWYSYKDGQILEDGKPLPHKSADWEYEVKLKSEVPDDSKRADLVKQYGSAAAAYFALVWEKAKNATTN